MADRTIRLGSMFFIDDKGRPRRADAGTKVSVHSDFVERFDRLNVLSGDEPPEPPRRRASKAKSED